MAAHQQASFLGEVAVSSSPVARFWLRLFLGLIAAICGLVVGLGLGERFGYAIAAWIDRDPAELKEMLIACFISAGLVTSVVAVWFVTWITGAGRGARIAALGAIGAAVGVGALMILSSYDWPKSHGTPVIDYELRLPEGVSLPSGPGPIDLTIWSGTAGQGCYVGRITRDTSRHEMAGKIVLNMDNPNPVMSLRLIDMTVKTDPRPSVTRYWRLPYTPDAALEQQWRPWERITFIAAPRGETVPPNGEYEIRYRLRRYM
jgi:hypothetical protein